MCIRDRVDTIILAATLVGVVVLARLGGIADGFAALAVAGTAFLAWAYAVGRSHASLAGGLVYIGWPVLTLMWFRDAPLGAWLVLYCFVLVWAVDSCALFTGKTIGGARIAPRISPNKTWAGLIGAVVGAMVVTGWMWAGFESANIVEFDFGPVVLLSCILALVAQGADFFESAVKRRRGVKDSGVLLPGHGGLLDRVDGQVGVMIFLSLLVMLRGGAPADAVWIW